MHRQTGVCPEVASRDLVYTSGRVMSCSSIQRVIDVQEGLIGGFVPETLS
jgi:hypothetical protein